MTPLPSDFHSESELQYGGSFLSLYIGLHDNFDTTHLKLLQYNISYYLDVKQLQHL